MAHSLNKWQRRWRRWWPEAVALLVIGAFLLSAQSIAMWSDRQGVASGWLLFVLLAILMLYGVRKRFPHWSLGRATGWRQWHTILGWLASVVFLFHAGPLPPEGTLDQLLWYLFLLTLVLGVIGIILTRVLPKDLDGGGQRQLFERLPGMAWALSQRCSAMIAALPDNPSSAPVIRYYRLRVLSPMSRPLTWRTRLNERRLKRRLGELDAVQKRLGGVAYDVAGELASLLVTRTELERQYRALFWLRLWVEVHLSLAVAATLVVLVHILARYGFRL